MNSLIYSFLLTLIMINSSIAIYESLKPHSWLHFIEVSLNRHQLVKIYTAVLLILFTCISLILLLTHIIIRLSFFVWIINIYILLSAFLFLFHFKFLKDSFHSFKNEFPDHTQKRMVYLDSFLRLVASMILGASLIT